MDMFDQGQGAALELINDYHPLFNLPDVEWKSDANIYA